MQTDLNGNFTIKNVIPGAYGLHGWVPGFIGDYLDNARITVSSGTEDPSLPVKSLPIFGFSMPTL